MINVTKSFMPPIEEYQEYLRQIWESGYLTNEGPLLKRLVTELKQYLNIENIEMINNGTVALELAIHALEIEGSEIITTPFTFIATSTSIVWKNCKPVFVDINPNDFTIDVSKIEEAITNKTKAIMAVHVFGYPCDVEAIEKIAQKHNLKVIYDAAHAFGVKYKGKSLLAYGDVSTCSFHATKLFHTIEGGACFSKEKNISDKIGSLKKFGKEDGEDAFAGTNGKMSEFNAGMGLANLKYIDTIIEKRKAICELYDSILKEMIQRPEPLENLEYNYAYYPAIFESEGVLLKVIQKLNDADIYPRRYFYPSLNTISYLKTNDKCPISEDIANRIICLPLSTELTKEEAEKIIKIIKEA